MTRSIRLLCVHLVVFGMMAPAAGAQVPNDQKAAGLYRESYGLEAKGDYRGAAAKVREVRQASPASYFAVVRLAWLQYLSGDYNGSASTYVEASAIDGKAIEPKLGLTLPLLAAKRWNDLERACRDVLAVEPQNTAGRARLAQALYWNGNLADAATLYQGLSAEYPADLDYKTGLGWALRKQGRVSEAKQLFQVVLVVSPDNVSAKEGLK